MSRLNTSETRALQRGETIVRERRNADTGETYSVDVKLSWDTLYYRMPTSTGDWHKTPGAARRATEAEIASIGSVSRSPA